MVVDREEERRALVEQENAEKDLRAAGVRFVVLDANDKKTEEEILKAAAIAKITSKTQISVKILKDGRLQNLVEEVGQEDLIFQALLYRRAAQGGS